MARLLIFFSISLLSFCSSFSKDPKSQPLKTYIVHVRLPADLMSSSLKDVENFYHSFLPKTATGMNDVSRMLHSYQNVFTGFAAKLSPEEVKEMENKEGFLQARPEAILSRQTTHSPEFMGLYPDHGVWPESDLGSGVVIGLLDGGIKADHPSFSDENMPNPPLQWKGVCNLNGTSCNKKLIGARNLISSGGAVDVDSQAQFSKDDNF